MSDIVTLNGYKIKDEKAVRSYESIAQMKADTKLKEGYHVKTKGYYEANDGGHGEYVIVDDDTLVDDGGLIHVLTNGLRAKLLLENDCISIKQLGANENVSNDTNALKVFANSNIKTLIIPSGNYKLNDIIDLENKELIGIGNPIIEINGITTEREHTIQVSGSCHISGIKFVQSIAMTNIMGLFGAYDTIIEKCSFKVDDVRCNGYFDLYTDNHNIKVLNCDFDCVSTEIVDSEKVNAIGGIWVRQFDNDHESYNIIFENCNISHQSKDEAIAIWKNTTPCLLSNVQVNNCVIKLKPNATSPHCLTLNANNSSFNNCVIERFYNTESRSSVFNQVSTNNVPVSINNCIINTNTIHGNGIFNTHNATINNCVINDTSTETRLCGEGTIINNSTINCKSFQNQFNNVQLKNCEINMNAQTHSWLFRHSVKLINNIFNFISANPTQIIYCLADNENNVFYLDGNIFNFYNNGTPLLINMGSRTVNKLYAYNNKYIGQITNATTNVGVVANNITLDTLNTFDNIKMNNNYNINS